MFADLGQIKLVLGIHNCLSLATPSQYNRAAPYEVPVFILEKFERHKGDL